MITLHFKTDKANKSNFNTFVCLKENGVALIGESCQESDKKETQRMERETFKRLLWK